MDISYFSLDLARSALDCCLSSGALLKSPNEANDRLSLLYPDWAPDSNINKNYELMQLLSPFWGLIEKSFTPSELSSVISSLILLNPHTHWGEQGPILVDLKNYDKALVIGIDLFNISADYLPVSFASIQGRLVPYEWINASLILSIDIYKLCLGLASVFGALFDTVNIGFSIGYNYRNILYAGFPAAPTIEVEDSPYRATVYSMQKFSSLFKEQVSRSNIVSWPFLSYFFLRSMSTSQLAVFYSLLERFENLDYDSLHMMQMLIESKIHCNDQWKRFPHS